ncbi:MAG: OB-fold nucleic acid binding domain-containing protein, partial [Candidatus Micrarchaeia archaeon]
MLWIEDILKGNYDGKEVEFSGWVYRHRVASNLVFIILRDPTGILQCTVKKELAEQYEKARNL